MYWYTLHPFSGDASSNTWFTTYGKNADLAIHQSFPTLDMLAKNGYNPQAALNMAGMQTLPPGFARVMNEIKPRMAVAYHFFNDLDSRYPIYDSIRQIYKGPLTMATDLVVWNITKKDIRVREAIVDEAVWPAIPPTPRDQPDHKEGTPLTPFVEKGRLDVSQEMKPMIEDFKKKHNLK